MVKRTNNKKMIVISLAMVCAMALSACSLDPMPNLSEENKDAVVSYSTGILMEHDKHHISRYLEDEELQEELTRLQTLADNKVNSQVYSLKNQEEKEAEKKAKQDALDSTPVVDNATGTTTLSSYIDEVCEYSDFTIRFKGYKVCDSYPESTDSLYFVMEPTSGKKLLILEFVASNVTGEDKVLNMMDSEAKFLVTVNGNKTQYVLSTLLLDDLASFKGTIGAGQSETLVLVTEVDELSAQDITSVTLNMEIGSRNATISLD